MLQDWYNTDVVQRPGFPLVAVSPLKIYCHNAADGALEASWPRYICEIGISHPSFFNSPCMSLFTLNFKSKNNNINLPSLSHHSTLINRKVLASKFDFTSFQRHPQQRHSPDVVEPAPPVPVDNEIDPRYGVEKRLVPTGPNPLHH
ncbi:hypothetical protein HHK36_015037 [Tetracentron sinense]|uniref:Uncharacterized protein n=1 Tax=Tetracentron sinense TaxID=13715 RepID=A0A834ZAA2_TETSI|nr:hypothetical protein HHK36_015037 [Tetracentron sinense]